MGMGRKWGKWGSGDRQVGLLPHPSRVSRVALTQMRHQLLGSGASGASGAKNPYSFYKNKKKREEGLLFFFYFPRAIWDFLPHFTPLPS